MLQQEKEQSRLWGRQQAFLRFLCPLERLFPEAIVGLDRYVSHTKPPSSSFQETALASDCHSTIVIPGGTVSGTTENGSFAPLCSELARKLESATGS